MAKRNASEAFDNVQTKSNKGQKYSLDSDEEDSDVEKEKADVLNVNDIEGEEDGIGGIEGEITITPFNMKEELEDGHFDTQGHYHWKKEKEIEDAWLDNIDWVKIKGRPEDKYKVHKDVVEGHEYSSSEDETEPVNKVNIKENYKEILQHMKPKETIAKTIQRLGKNISSAERWKRKKAGIVDEGSKLVTRITELANQILTQVGNMDVYQESYEKIHKMVAENVNQKDELDMYADDFDHKEKKNLQSKEHNDEKISASGNEEYESKDTKWVFKWKQDDDAEISGPHTTEQMQKWSQEGFFKTGVWVKKEGEDCQFYNSNRIDFEIYM